MRRRAAREMLLIPVSRSQLNWKMPSAPASSMRCAICPALMAVWPVPRQAVKRRCASWRCCSSRAIDSGSANSSHCACGRQLISGSTTATNLPRTCGSHASKSAGALKSGNATTSPSTAPFVPALHASMVASSVRTRGRIRSTCVMPRRQPR